MSWKKFITIQYNLETQKITTKNVFLNVDNGSTRGTHRACFHQKDSKSRYFDSFSGLTGNLLLDQKPKP